MILRIIWLGHSFQIRERGRDIPLPRPLKITTYTSPPGQHKNLAAKQRNPRSKVLVAPGLWNDLKTMAWMTEPGEWYF